MTHFIVTTIEGKTAQQAHIEATMAPGISKTYAYLKTLSGNGLTEFLVSKVNVEELNFLEGLADFDELPELAYAIFCVRFPK